MKKLLFAIIFILTISNHSNAISNSVVAVVGKNSITEYEVKQRAKIVALLQNYNMKDPSIMSYLESEMINYLIEEEIKRDYAKRAKIEISSEMMNEVINNFIAKKGYNSVEKFMEYLVQNGINPDVFKQTVKDDISWNQVLRNAIAPAIKVTEEEGLQRLKNNGTDNPSDAEILAARNAILEEKVALQVKKLITQMKKFYLIEALQ
jgi:hypothetical protein